MLLLILPFLCQIDILALYSCWYSYFPYDQAIAPLLYSLSLQLFLVSSMCMINELVLCMVGVWLFYIWLVFAQFGLALSLVFHIWFYIYWLPVIVLKHRFVPCFIWKVQSASSMDEVKVWFFWEHGVPSVLYLLMECFYLDYKVILESHIPHSVF